ncbi:methylase [Cytobacillus firmus]|uniref:class I SAM-dependent methyltransferase n=1 Tax=Cytobacillus firmus TaxID=1399 RepID=UPI00077C227B|nr:class I SAM-dependent methyltransferase [Cytobacillus firmus]MBG9542247.1 methylase [Cytobacillus firmus]MBG9553732.1 methylase [Cytobacillus firmus]MBG9556202.1 methylase [Cytobacillus firmus]MBG9573731.1 methylase [Cytobacillus firmus]MBG9656434.1 methylase [Cytobacillus firmus]
MEKDEIKKKVQNTFGKNAEKYVTSKIHGDAAELDQLVQTLNPQKDWVVLDIATGGGHVAKSLAPFVSQVFAADLTKEMLANTARHLESYKNIWYIIADAEALPFLDESFDAVTCRIAPHHFPHPEKFIAEAGRVLKPGGSFLLVDNVSPDEKELADYMNTVEKLRDDSHCRCLSAAEWRKLFAASGLNETNTKSRKKTFEFPSWVRRTAESDEQISAVEEYILQADQAAADYFQIELHEGKVQSFKVDEWMALYVKQ